MATYKAPLRDMRFVFHELLDSSRLYALPGNEELSADLVDAVLEEAARFCENELNPLNQSADAEGCTFRDGEVTTPHGFKEAYAAFVEAGWNSLASDPAYGGQGLPYTINLMVEEMICGANLSFSLYPGLTHGAYEALRTHGTEELKSFYLPKLVSGKWSGTMCLTEPHSGTDLGLLRTKAVPQEDGTYRVTGTKIFISAGEHDLTDNIVHLVLARTPDAPKGIRGISLFIVPKFKANQDGSIGARNGVSCGSIEHKMGLNGSATCVINFDEAEGYLVGQLHKGMRGMFTMMNSARLGVGIQGLGIGEAAYQGAVAYARDRIQGRSLTGIKQPDKAADSIIVHPDVRRMLLTMRAYNEGCRAIAGWVAQELDIAHNHPDPQVRAEADELVALLTPVVKGLFTDLGSETANIGVQVFGGHGYIREQGMEQYVRDARITQIYEGTNGIQALDLIGRKLPDNMGRMLRRFFHPVSDFLEQNQDSEALAEFLPLLAKAFGRLQKATAWIAEKGMKNPDDPAAVACDYLRLFGFVAMAYQFARSVQIASAKLEGDERAFYQAKIDTARFFYQRLLPQTSGLFSAMLAGGRATMAFAEEAF